jgi:hypothetical protein
MAALGFLIDRDDPPELVEALCVDCCAADWPDYIEEWPVESFVEDGNDGWIGFVLVVNRDTAFADRLRDAAWGCFVRVLDVAGTDLTLAGLESIRARLDPLGRCEVCGGSGMVGHDGQDCKSCEGSGASG